MTAAADKISAYGGLQKSLSAMADNKRFTSLLNSDFSDKLLSNMLLAHSDARSIAVFTDDKPMELVQTLLGKSISAFAQALFLQAGPQTVQAITCCDTHYLVLREHSSDRKHQLLMKPVR